MRGSKEVVITILANRYRVIKRLGKGGMGSVYLARDNKLNMLWAIKELGDSNQFLSHARKSEISVLRRVSHPNLPRVTDIFDEDKKTWMVMDYIEGKTLEDILSSAKSIPPKKVCQWSIEIASALQYLHSMKPPVIYRDMKPSNIIIRPSGSAVLIDFGTAKSYEAQKDEYALGTKGYAAPEQYEGRSDKRSDIYSLGKVISRMAGKKTDPFIKRICRKCTAKDPSKRYQSAESLKRALILWRDAYKYAAVIAVVFVLVFLGVCQSRSAAQSSVRDIEEINESGRLANLYDNALMCFYELKDYDSALGYFEQLDAERIPEVLWYEKLCNCLISPQSTREDVLNVARAFREFNDRELELKDHKRKLKNDTDIARIYLMYSEGDASLLSEAVELLSRVNEEYEKDTAGVELRENTLLLLFNAYKSLGQIEDMQKNYTLAVKCGDRLKELVNNDPEFVIKRYLDNARLFTEMSMYAKAKAEYEECERLYPGVSQDIYIGHLSLLMSTGASPSQLRAFYEEALKVKGINENREFKKISERIAYE